MGTVRGAEAARPRVAVLLATHQGEAFLAQQIDSILEQQGVDVRLVISDDASSDGTLAVIERYAADPRVQLLPPRRLGAAAANFLRLIVDADASGYDAVALSDQDDVWLPGRLADQLQQLRHADAVSANVVADFGDRRRLIDKAQPQRSLDFVLESAGPGCTFVLSQPAFGRVRSVVTTDSEAAGAFIHDWLIYAIVRASGMRWHIDSAPVLDYRQHATNVAGANVGVRQAVRRLDRIRRGDFRREAAVIARIAARAATGTERRRIAAVAALLDRHDVRARLTLLRGVGSLRRRASERAALALLLILGIW